jgi:hypothetical protein
VVAAGDLERIFGVLEAANVRYLVVGGVAVVLHGHPRFTADLDIVLDLRPDNARLAILALDGLGYRPRAPVAALSFADESTRTSWVEDKGMVVFSMWSPQQPATEIDLFVRAPFDFDVVFARAVQADLGSTRVSVLGLGDLLDLKRAAARPKDLEDVRALEAIAVELEGDSE